MTTPKRSHLCSEAPMTLVALIRSIHVSWSIISQRFGDPLTAYLHWQCLFQFLAWANVVSSYSASTVKVSRIFVRLRARNLHWRKHRANRMILKMRSSLTSRWSTLLSGRGWGCFWVGLLIQSPIGRRRWSCTFLCSIWWKRIDMQRMNRSALMSKISMTSSPSLQ